jgi:hypothetical protein
MKNTGMRLNKDYDLDILVKRDGQGKIVSGLVIGEVTAQNQAMLLYAQKGEYKEYPLVGVGINDMVNDSDFDMWKKEITEQIEADGQRISKLVVNEKELILEASYK